MEYLKFIRFRRFSNSYLVYLGLHLFQIDKKDPVLLCRFRDFVRGAWIYPIGYSHKDENFYGLFIPGRWDKVRGLKTERIIFDEEGLQDNIMFFDPNFKSCKLSELKKGL